MHVSQAEYITIKEHPYLSLTIDGKEALIGDFKKSLLDKGVVPLRSRILEVNWSLLLPKITLVQRSDPPLILEGFTKDPVIIKLAQDYWNAINGDGFVNGPIPIPDLKN